MPADSTRRHSLNVLLMGDTAAGKSESLEAFRILRKEHIRALRIIADDMGSLEIAQNEKVLGYGPEIGAFIRWMIFSRDMPSDR